MDKPFYCYLVQSKNGEMTLHIKDCLHRNDGIRRIFLGSIYTQFQAMNLAKKHSSDISLCQYCMGEQQS
ncbi:hypothetical protein PMI17_00494 [Pantoea sp. GM01]|nr:hypothetical protein PMI17_00494 [Pantoea sp. GM01]